MNKAIESYHVSVEESTRVKAVAGVVFNDKAQILLGLSSLPDEFRKDKWCFPGGGHERGETVYQTGVREVFEETGIKAIPLNLSPIIDTDRPSIQFIGMKRISGQIRTNGEFSDMDWFSINSLPRDMVKQNKKVLTRLVNKIRKQSQEFSAIGRLSIQKGFCKDVKAR